MARIFEDITLAWEGEEYTIPSDRVLGAIARIEEHVTLTELHKDALARGTVRMSRLSMAYASVLRYAGAKVKDEDVYAAMFMDGGDANQRAMEAMHGLMAMMIPPSVLDESNKGGSQASPGKTKGASSSSRKATKSRSAKAG